MNHNKKYGNYAAASGGAAWGRSVQAPQNESMQLNQLHHLFHEKTMQLNQLHNFHIFYYESYF